MKKLYFLLILSMACVASLLPAVADATATSAATERAAARVVVPKVVGMRMDQATRTLKQRGLRVNEECSGLFGCIVKSRWWVCTQSPRAGRRVPRYSVVVIYAERRGEC
jgi:PASTA domain